MFCMLIIMNINIQGFLSTIVAKGDDFQVFLETCFGSTETQKNNNKNIIEYIITKPNVSNH